MWGESCCECQIQCCESWRVYGGRTGVAGGSDKSGVQGQRLGLRRSAAEAMSTLAEVSRGASQDASAGTCHYILRRNVGLCRY